MTHLDNSTNNIHECKILLVFYMYLFERQSYMNRGTEREGRFCCPDTLCTWLPYTMAETGCGQGQEPGTSSRSPRWVVCPKHLSHLLPSQAHELGAGWGGQQLGFKPELMRDAGVAGSASPCHSLPWPVFKETDKPYSMNIKCSPRMYLQFCIHHT